MVLETEEVTESKRFVKENGHYSAPLRGKLCCSENSATS